MSESPAQMPPELVQLLLGGQTCVVATVDAQGRPMTTLMTWVVARNPMIVSLAADLRGRALANLRANPQMALEVLADDMIFALRGHAVIEKERMESPPFGCAQVALHVEECKNHGASGVRFVGPQVHFATDKQHRSAVELAIFEELKGSAPTI